MDSLIPNYRYIAYIDEAGDESLKTVRPIDSNGASEWLIMSAIVLDSDKEDQPLLWVREMMSKFMPHQRPDIHFNKLNPAKKSLACATVGTLPLRCFVVASNKKNMRGYLNTKAEKIPSRNWFYCWMMRLLLERVTHFVKDHSLRKYGSVQKVKIIYSKKGGHSYSQMGAYYKYLKSRPLYLNQGIIQWDTMHEALQEVHRHETRAGLQLADIVASSFYKACDIYHTGACDPQFAKLLLPRMARYPDNNKGQIAGYGVKLMPHSLLKANLLPEQEEIYKYCGYPKYWWAPDSSDSQAFSSTSNGQASW